MVDLNLWLKEAKVAPNADKCGMYLTHNGVVRSTAKAQVRDGISSAPVTGMNFSYNAEKVALAKEQALAMPGIYYVRIELEEGELSVGDDIMYLLIGGDTRPHTLDAFNFLMDEIKSKCVKEIEL